MPTDIKTSAPIPKKKKSPGSTALLFLTFGLVLLVLFVPELRDFLGRVVGFAFEPLIGFGGANPLLTIFLASIILVVATTAIRHFLVDWVKMARVQEAMRSFQKEFLEARKSNNTYKIKKLTDAQPQVMELQAEMSTEQLKPMVFTMLLVIPIFAWLGTFMAAEAPGLAADQCALPVRVPWDGTWELLGPASCGGGWWFLPHWIILYSLFGIPFGQIAQRALKLWEYRHVDLDGDGKPPTTGA